MMKTIFLLGFFLTLGGTGGIENSMDDTTMLQSFAIAVLGLALMYAGLPAIKEL